MFHLIWKFELDVSFATYTLTGGCKEIEISPRFYINFH